MKRKRIETGKRATFWLPVIGLGLPFVLILLPTLLIARSPLGFLGISAAIWCLFACAPLTSLCLALCWIFVDRKKMEGDSGGPDPGGKEQLLRR